MGEWSSSSHLQALLTPSLSSSLFLYFSSFIWLHLISFHISLSLSPSLSLIDTHAYANTHIHTHTDELTLEVISTSPKVYLVKNFLSALECEILKDMAGDNMNESVTGNAATGGAGKMHLSLAYLFLTSFSHLSLSHLSLTSLPPEMLQQVERRKQKAELQVMGGCIERTGS
jgi:hypothetical protein